jgi:hypothetical protein
MMLNLNHCDVTKPFNMAVDNNEGKHLEAFVPSKNGNSMIVTGLDLKLADSKDTTDAFNNKTKWQVHLPGQIQSHSHPFVCTALGNK